MKQRELKLYFDEFNEKYFDGALKAKVRFKKLRGLGMTRLKHRKFTIAIDSSLRYSRRLVLTTLLHEMAHISCDPTLRRGNCDSARWNSFNNEMLRLAKAGALNGWW